jgi:microcystin-dependent protein
MSEPFLAEIRITGFNFAPEGWAFCNGQLLAISQNTALFSLFGTSYGGDGKTTFALPNLQGRAPMHWGQGPGLSPRAIGESGGEQSVTLGSQALPSHSHQLGANAGGGNQTLPANNVWSSLAGRTPPPLYSNASNTTMSPQAAGVTGGGQPHNNMPPYLALNFIIALTGNFPPRA